MVSMWIGLMVNRFGNRGQASKSRAEIDRWAVAYQRLERESECRRKEQAERSERQKRCLLRTLHSQQLHLGTKSRAMQDRLARRYQRSMSRAQNEATGLRKELRKVQTKPATIDPNESHGLVAHLRWQYDHAKLIIIKQSSTITRTEARVGFLQVRVDKFLLRQFHPDSAAHQLENDLKFRTKQLELMEKVNGMSVECMLDTFTNESALILVQMVRLENRIDALSIDNHNLQAKWQRASTLMLQPRPTEAPVQPQIVSSDKDTAYGLVSQLSAMEEELRQARADLDAKADHRSKSPSVESERNEANERLSVENSKIQEINRQLSSELCETKVKLGHVTCCLQDALLPERFPTTLKTNRPSAAEMLDEDSVQTTLIESGSKAIRAGRRSSVFQMEGLQGSIARPLAPLRRRSMSAAITVSSADTISSIPSSVESMSLQEIVAILRLVHGNQSQLGQDDAGLPGDKGYSEETCSTASQGGDPAIIEGDGTPASFEGQPARKKHVRKRRRHRKMREELESQAFDENLARPPPSNQL